MLQGSFCKNFRLTAFSFPFCQYLFLNLFIPNHPPLKIDVYQGTTITAMITVVGYGTALGTFDGSSYLHSLQVKEREHCRKRIPVAWKKLFFKEFPACSFSGTKVRKKRIFKPRKEAGLEAY